jgi:curved DNA-binding protein CbpA
MDKGDDPYEILGVSYDATDAEIKKAFRKGALKYHPDKQETEEDKEEAHHIFAKFADAYDTLTDLVKRYDWKQANEGKMRRAASGAASSTSSTSGGSRNAPPSQQKSPTVPPPNRQQPPNSNGQPPPQKRPTAPIPNKQHSPPPKNYSAPKRPSPAAPNTKHPPQQKGTSDTSSNMKHPPQKHPPQKHPPQKHPPRQSPAPKKGRDPFDIFENVMKEEFGEGFKDSEKSGWKQSIGVPGLAKLNVFKKNKGESSKKEFKKLDVNKDKSLSKDELGSYIESHSELWSTLGMNLGLSVKRCIEIATDVAYSLAMGEENKPRNNEYRIARDLDEAEFSHFHKKYVLDEKGSHEFFLRTIFSVFDANGDGVLEAKELDRFLDIFYKAKDIFKGDMRLPEKKELVRIVGGRLDKNKDGVLSFNEIRDLLEVAAVVTTDKGSS